MEFPTEILDIIFDYKAQFELRERLDEQHRRFMAFFNLLFDQLLLQSALI